MLTLHRARRRFLAFCAACVVLGGLCPAGTFGESGERRLLYVAAPGIRNYLEYGGHGLLVFDIDDGHKFVSRHPDRRAGRRRASRINVKGVCASAATGRLYVSTLRTLYVPRPASPRRSLWEKAYEGGCDRMAITPGRQGRSTSRRSRRTTGTSSTRATRRRDREDRHRSPARTTRSSASTARASTWPGCKSPLLTRRGHAQTHEVVEDGRPVRRRDPAVHGQRPADAAASSTSTTCSASRSAT